MFIVIEGIEGSGKSTLSAELGHRLRDEGHDIVETREPGGTQLGDAVREIFLRTSIEISALSESLLFNAARAQHVSTVIRPGLELGRIVLCDRFTDSTLAYQGYGRGLDFGLLRSACKIATGDLEPDITFLLDLPLDMVRDRLTERHDQLALFRMNLARAQSDRIRLKDQARNPDRFERENDAFLGRVRRGFLELAQGSARHRVLDATLPPEGLVAEALREVHARLKAPG